jgi:predicted nucleic acid-binding protein
MPNVLVDTGPLVALFRPKDRDHGRVVGFLRNSRASLVTTWPVTTEVWHLLGEAGRLKFIDWIAAGGVAVLELGPQAVEPVARLLRKYRDRPMDLVDASLVVLAERLGVNDIVTIDRDDFETYRLSGGRRFRQLLSNE